MTRDRMTNVDNKGKRNLRHALRDTAGIVASVTMSLLGMKDCRELVRSVVQNPTKSKTTQRSRSCTGRYEHLSRSDPQVHYFIRSRSADYWKTELKEFDENTLEQLSKIVAQFVSPMKKRPVESPRAQRYYRPSYTQNFETFEKLFNLYLDKLDVCKCDFKVNPTDDRRPTVHELALHAHHRAQTSSYIESMILKVIRNPNDADVPFKTRQFLRTVIQLLEPDKKRVKCDHKIVKSEKFEKLKIVRQSSLRKNTKMQVIDCPEPPVQRTLGQRVPYHPDVTANSPQKVLQVRLDSEQVMTRRQYRMTVIYNSELGAVKILQDQQKKNLLGRSYGKKG